MIKIQPFQPSYKKMKASFEKKLKDRFSDPFSVPGYSSYGYQQDIPVFDYNKLSKLSQDQAHVEEVWINPDSILRIKVKTNKMSDERFLEILMKNGDTYEVAGDSVQEFFMRNIVLGNDVS